MGCSTIKARIALAATACAAAVVVASSSACDTSAPGDASPSTAKRSQYEVHAQMDDAQAAGLWSACPADDCAALIVRALSAPQPSGVDVRVEFAGFMTAARAACIDAYLEAHGAKEFETDTMHWSDSDSSAGAGSTSGPASTSGP